MNEQGQSIRLAAIVFLLVFALTMAVFPPLGIVLAFVGIVVFGLLTDLSREE